MQRISRIVGHLAAVTSIGEDEAETDDLLRLAELSCVPVQHVISTFPSTVVLEHTRWLQQKYALRQDVCLLGPPGALKLGLALLFCELMKLPFETLCITRDTTEADLKQRADIQQGSLVYRDQAPVRCALLGRVLILDGLEKAERNVLPTLNNLLENREIALSDGRFIVASARYDALRKMHSVEELRLKKLIRAHPNFWVIALALPVPRFPGFPLDPPLRSRFQARTIGPLPLNVKYREMLYWNRRLSGATFDHPQLQAATLNVLSAVSALRIVSEGHGAVSGGQRLPYFSDSGCSLLVEWLRMMSLAKLPVRVTTQEIEMVFPFREICSDAQVHSVCELLSKFEIHPENKKELWTFDGHIEPREQYSAGDTKRFLAKLSNGNGMILPLAFGDAGTDMAARNIPRASKFVRTSAHQVLLASMLQSHALGRDVCIIGEKGSGKSAFARHAADVLQYAHQTCVISLYKDMSARDLLMRRSTDEAGNSTWMQSPLLQACLEGNCVILDGLDKLNPSVLSAVYPLIHRRELTLFDGTRLLPAASVAALSEKLMRFASQRLGMKEDDAKDAVQKTLASVPILPIPSSFRIIALALPAKQARGRRMETWLLDETIPLFCFHRLPPLDHTSVDFLLQIVPSASASDVERLLELRDSLAGVVSQNEGKKSHTAAEKEERIVFSLRHFARILRRITVFPGDMSQMVSDALLVPFLPLEMRYRVRSIIGMEHESSKVATDLFIEHTVDESGAACLCIGEVSVRKKVPTSRELIPDILFVDIQQHLYMLQNMLKDLYTGERNLLLIGNQGTGKNKLCDRLLQLLDYEREYMQLHRDTTVQALTLAPTLRAGTVVFEDSALVRAATHGHCLVIDEADKAPLEVVAVLKALVEDGEMLLSDGRRILRNPTAGSDGNVIPLHDGFRLIVLANRPGFPFLGNDFFREMGDVLSCHVVENPDYDSELTLLRAYGPSVSAEVLDRLIKCFARLRSAVDDGDFTYPYSTRELVNVVKHLNKFPGDGLIRAIENVLSFDAYDADVKQSLQDVFSTFGIPVLRSGFHSSLPTVGIAKVLSLPSAIPLPDWTLSAPKGFTESHKHIWKGHTWSVESSLEKHTTVFASSRLDSFSEEIASFCGVPASVSASNPRDKEPNSIPVALTAWNDGSVFVLSNSPLTLNCFFPEVSSFRKGYLRVPLEEAVPPVAIHGRDVVLCSVGGGSNLVVICVPAAGLIIFVQISYRVGNKPRSHVGVLSAPDLSMDSASKIRAQMMAYSSSGYRRPTFSGSGSQEGHSFARTCANLVESYGLVVFQLHSLVFLLELREGQSAMEEGKFTRSVNVIDVGKLLPKTHVNSALVLPITPDQLLLECKHGPDPRKYMLSRIGDRWQLCLIENPVQAVFEDVSSCDTSHVMSDACGALLKVDVLARAKRVALVRGFPGDDSYEHLCSLVSDRVAMITRAREKGLQRICIVDNVGIDATPTLRYLARRSRATIADLQSDALSLQELGSQLPDRDRKPASIVSAAPIPGASKLLTLERDGFVRVFETCPVALNSQLREWRALYGDLGVRERSIAEESFLQAHEELKTPTRDPSMPKEGKVDDEEHFGGNTFKGGSGGRDTAGLGGVGGPYREDGGHPVHQMESVSDAKVSTAAAQAAREMKEKLLREQLRAIDMNETDFDAYQEYYSHVSQEIIQLRQILSEQEAKNREREWLRNQKDGDLDDEKLVDGLVGSRHIYRRRGKASIPDGLPQRLPKRMHFVIDVSGSMYRFNSVDKRLDRMVDTVLLIMEAFQGFETKFEYSLVGHSGDHYNIVLSDYGKPPSTSSEKFKLLQSLAVHSQYCSSGDSTLRAMKHGMETVVKQDADDYYLFVISDANLQRYDITPARLRKILDTDARVNSYCIFIASGGDSLEREIEKVLPQRAYFCATATTLPWIFSEIFAHAALQSD